MPLQNRVTPFGDIVAIPQRGLFTGNRGILHDPETKRLLSRRWATKAWITCLCEYKGVRRQVMGGRSWTELFFLDEATALAAGHRPCFFCRRDAASTFRAAWAAGNRLPLPKAPEMDRTLHGERLRGRSKRLHPLTMPQHRLPTGAMVTANGDAFLIAEGQVLRWHPDGYRPAEAAPVADALITPPATLRALAAGYRPVLHPSAAAALDSESVPTNRHSPVPLV